MGLCLFNDIWAVPLELFEKSVCFQGLYKFLSFHEKDRVGFCNPFAEVGKI
jgi:hypothetical protein